MKIFIAILVGLISASLTFSASKLLGLNTVWPGTVFSFASSALMYLMILRNEP